MSSKKGFTLVEVLGVIVILGILALLVTNAIMGYFEEGKEDYNKNKLSDQLLIAGKAYFADHRELLPTEVSEKMYGYVTVPTMQSENYIKNEFVDSEGRKCTPSYVYVRKKPGSEDTNQYQYFPCLICTGDTGKVINYSEKLAYCNPSLWLNNELPPEIEKDDVDPVGSFTCVGFRENGVTTIEEATSLFGISRIFYVIGDSTNYIDIPLTEEESVVSEITNKVIKGLPDNAKIFLVDMEGNVSQTCDITSKIEEKHFCELYNDKYYDDDGNVVTKAVYESKCKEVEETHYCEKYNGKYYGKDGAVVSEATYKNQCVDKPSPPKPVCKFISIPSGYTTGEVKIIAECENTYAIEKNEDFRKKVVSVYKKGKIVKVSPKRITNKKIQFTITYKPYNNVEDTDSIALKYGFVNNYSEPKKKSDRVDSKEFKVDTKKPVITITTVDKSTGKWSKTTFCQEYINKGHSQYYGYKDKVKVKETCVDGYSGIKVFKINNKSVSSPHYSSKASSGSLKVVASCTDKAGNVANLTKSFRVLAQHSNCNKCCVKEYKSCPNSSCTCKKHVADCSKCGGVKNTTTCYSYSYYWGNKTLLCGGQYPIDANRTCNASSWGGYKHVKHNLNCYDRYTCLRRVASSWTCDAPGYKYCYSCNSADCKEYYSCVSSSCGPKTCYSCYY